MWKEVKAGYFVSGEQGFEHHWKKKNHAKFTPTSASLNYFLLVPFCFPSPAQREKCCMLKLVAEWASAQKTKNRSVWDIQWHKSGNKSVWKDRISPDLCSSLRLRTTRSGSHGRKRGGGAPSVNLTYMSSRLRDLWLCPPTSHSMFSVSSSRQRDRTPPVELMAQKSNLSVIGKRLRNGWWVLSLTHTHTKTPLLVRVHLLSLHQSLGQLKSFKVALVGVTASN